MRRAKTMAMFAAVAIVAGSVLTGPVAMAGDGDVIRTGSCSGRSDWKLKAGPEDRRLEVEFEVDQNVRGDTWRVVMKHDGDVFFRDRRTTRGPSGSFEIERRVDDSAGTDRFRARAVNLETDETCVGTVSI
jgi:hypothetical protein